MSSSETELENALSVFARFFDLIHQPITVINKEGNFIYYNEESAQIDNYNVQKALGKHVLDVYTRLSEEKSTILQSLRDGVEFIGNYQIYYNAKGKPVDYQHTTVPLYGKNGEIEGVIEIGRNMSDVRRLQQQVVELNRLLHGDAEEELVEDIVTRNKDMLELIEKAKKIALSDSSVVIIGETGTGKELFAHLIHKRSKRADKPFIALNCSTLPLSLIESSLFGTVKGAFTGAENSKGYLEIANEGTLFLDELNAMPLEMQSKLLRFLQDKSYWKVGGNQQLKSDVRIIAAMNEPPAQLIQSKQLRADMFYRLCVGMLVLPPLSERPEDIEMLAHYFIKKYREVTHSDIQGITDDALATLKKKNWPGNVRMLENVIVHSMMMQDSDGPLKSIAYDEEIFEVLPPESAVKATSGVVRPKSGVLGAGFNEQVEDFEIQLIAEALNMCHGNIAEAARRLKISRTTLHYKMKKFNVQLGVV